MAGQFMTTLVHLATLQRTASYATETESVSRGRVESIIVQELCESRGGRPGLSVLTNLMVSVDVKQY